MLEIRLKATNGQYVCAEGGGGAGTYLIANRATAAQWETFAVFNHTVGNAAVSIRHGDVVSLLSWNDFYVCAEGGGGGIVNVDRTSAGAWEKFIVHRIAGPGTVNTGDAVGFQTHLGQFLCGENGAARVNATRGAIGDWEKFTVENRPYVRKCIAMGLGGMTAGHDQNLGFVSGRYPDVGPGGYDSDNMKFIAETKTRWVRLMIDPLTFWPTQDSINTAARDQLDFQLALAKVYGCGTILTIGDRLPYWLNGTNDPKQRPSHFHLAEGGAWQTFIDAFAVRYNLYNTARPYGGASMVDILEVCNEPNTLMTPMGTSPYDTFDSLAQCVALMMKRAKQVIANYQGAPIIGAPCVNDVDSLSGANRDYYEFTDAVLDRLAGNGFYNVTTPAGVNINSSVVWTMHNYNDVSYDHGFGTTAPDAGSYPSNGDAHAKRTVLRSSAVAELLRTGGRSGVPWKGWPAGKPSPHIFITEGGAEFSKLAGAPWNISDYTARKAKQDDLTGKNNARLSVEGRGVDLVANYLTYSDHRTGVFGDSGLLDDRDDGGAVRPVYNRWKGFASRL